MRFRVSHSAIRRCTLMLFVGVAAVLLLAHCAATSRCPQEDLGGWMPEDDELTHGIRHTCVGDTERFTLQSIAKRRPDGGVAEWFDVAQLEVRLDRGETTIVGFECGSRENIRGDVIAVVRRHRNESSAVKRAWRIDTRNRQFVAVPPESIICESVE